jgi:D-3-phosphoglycerate dehydrogenase
MQVVAYDPYLSADKARSLGVRLVNLNELFRHSDFITIHSSLTNETRHIINRDTIGIMKDGVRIVNCARGGIVDEEALYDALKSGKVKAAAFDVFEKEPPVDCPLLSLDNFICTPHLGASTDEAQENVAIAVAEQIADYLKYKVIRNAVNFPSISPEDMAALQPFVNLGERLGLFLSQFMVVPIKEVVIEYKGEVAKLPTDPVKFATLKGLLTPILDEMLNYVNAPFIAKERGIVVKETTTDNAGDYVNMIELKIAGNGVVHSASGVLYGKKEPRIVEIDRFQIEFIPEGDMLVIANLDTPGVIGNIGSLLGSRGINIARMQWGREEKKGKAISIVTIEESKPTPELIRDLKNLPNVMSIRPVSLPLLST